MIARPVRAWSRHFPQYDQRMAVISRWTLLNLARIDSLHLRLI